MLSRSRIRLNWQKRYQIVDYNTREQVYPKNFIFTGENSPWEIKMDIATIKETLDIEKFKQLPPKLSKYLPLMPINPRNFLAIGDYPTPLITNEQLAAELKLEKLLLKLDGKRLTGSFKDPGSAMDVARAHELGAEAIVLASTGNMAASCACHAAVYGIKCIVVVPKGTPMTKLIQVKAHGAEIEEVDGTYDDAAKLAYEIAQERNYYLAGNYAYRLEGQKTTAFELMDQLGFIVPHVVIAPMGCGTNLAAIYKGLIEYKELGIITKIPRLIGVQAQGANAIVNSYNARTRIITRLAKINTIASAIAVAAPNDGAKALDAIYTTGGEASEVSDEEILAAQKLLATKYGLFVEAASATTIAYLKKHQDQLKHKTVVCILTGDGLKEPAPNNMPYTTKPCLKLYKNDCTVKDHGRLLASSQLGSSHHRVT